MTHQWQLVYFCLCLHPLLFPQNKPQHSSLAGDTYIFFQPNFFSPKKNCPCVLSSCQDISQCHFLYLAASTVSKL